MSPVPAHVRASRSSGLCSRAVRIARTRLRRNVSVHSNINDDLLDYIQAGPKLRKWYGETEKLSLPKDGGPSPDDDGGEDEDAGPRDAVLVTDADSPLGELIVLQLVLSRAKIRVLVKDVARAKQEFGPYVTAIAGDVNSGSALKQAMLKSRAVIIPGSTGQAVRAAAALGLDHIVLPCCSGQQGGLFGGLFGGAESMLSQAGRADEALSGPVACTVITFGKLLDCLGGTSYIEFSQGAAAAPGAISREDAALVAVRALSFPPQSGSGLEFSAGGAGAGVAPGKEEWEAMFANLEAGAPAAAQ